MCKVPSIHPDTPPAPAAKVRLGQAVKELLATHDLAQVTVTQVAKQAGVTRQAFYYHFEDVFDAAIWVFETEIADHILSHASYAQWAEGFEQLLAYMQRHREQVAGVIHTLSLERTERFFFHALREMMAAVVQDIAGDAPLNARDRKFLIDHYTLAVVGHLLHWIAQGMTEDPTELVGNIKFVMRGHVSESVQRMLARGHTAP